MTRCSVTVPIFEFNAMTIASRGGRQEPPGFAAPFSAYAGAVAVPMVEPDGGAFGESVVVPA